VIVVPDRGAVVAIHVDEHTIVAIDYGARSHFEPVCQLDRTAYGNLLSVRGETDFRHSRSLISTAAARRKGTRDSETRCPSHFA
jgi:hypothetical protein